MTHSTETTRLLARGTKPDCNYDVSISTDRKKRVRQFRYCICALLMCMLLITLVSVASYEMNVRDDFDNSEIDPPIILTLSYLPIPDKNYSYRITDKSTWNKYLEAGKQAVKHKDLIEQTTPSLPVSSPSYRHQKAVATSTKATSLAYIGYIEEYATMNFHRTVNSTNRKEKICANSSVALDGLCAPNVVKCNYFSKYRSLNGSCNNLKHPETYGVSYTAFRRHLPPDYADGISKPRVSQNGTPLPSSRVVSLEIHPPLQITDSKFSVMLAIWGQFLDHDMTATASSRKANQETISCCNYNGVTHPECFPVLLESYDPFTKNNVTCIEFVRSAPAPTCCLGPREQLNQVSAFIDGSVIYGADEELTRKLRTFDNGMLKMLYTEDGRALLPVSDDLTDGCNRHDQQVHGRYCFLTGDARANENLHLTSMHLLWARQHNLIALNLSKMNPHWTDEIIFQEARRIIGAQMQHITYNEFLPAILGEDLTTKFDLTPQAHGYYKKYNDSINPSIANSFATAAFRFAHSIIPSVSKLLKNDSSSPEFIQMHKMLFDPFKLYNAGELNRIINGALNTSIAASDTYFTDELKMHLFEKTAEKPKRCGLDLVTLNIQRGRDHGLPGYSKWREHCGLYTPKHFDDLKTVIDKDILQNIKDVYRNVEDIDLYTGAISEKRIKGTILGPTLTCLIMDQFIRVKKGDRFWYENFHEPSKFTIEQLSEIRKTTLASIICDNADNLEYVQPRVLEGLNFKNRYVPCSKVPKLNITFWRQELHHVHMDGDSPLNITTIRL